MRAVALPRVLLALSVLFTTLSVAPGASATSATSLRYIIQVRDAAAVADVAALTGRAGGDVTAEFPVASALAANMTSTAAAAVGRSDDVVAITPDVELRPQLAQSTPLVGATTTRAAGFDGKGRAIVVIDTGVQAAHPFLQGSVVNGACFSKTANCPNRKQTQRGIAAGAPCTFSDDCFHGTHVAGIVAGHGSDFSGVAPGASILSIAVASADKKRCNGKPCLTVSLADILSGLQQAYAWHSAYDIAAVNISISMPGAVWNNCDAVGGVAPFKKAIDALRSVGIPTVVAAGNDGATYGVGFPACITSAIAVGATTKLDAVAPFSNSSGTLDVWAPGVNITSSVPTATDADGFASASGTSMAAPHIAGAFAVVDQLLPTASLATKQYRVTSTGPFITNVRNGVRRHRLLLTTDVTPPQTRITKKPLSTVRLATVTFAFGSEAGALHYCKLDAGSWTVCTSPRSFSVPVGTHTFQVHDRDLAGNLDPTPAVATWRRTA